MARCNKSFSPYNALSINTQTTNLDNSACGRSDTRPKVCALLGDGASDGGTLDFTFRVHDDSGVVCEGGGIREREGVRGGRKRIDKKVLFKKRILNMRCFAQQKMKDMYIIQQHIERQRGNAPSK